MATVRVKSRKPNMNYVLEISRQMKEIGVQRFRLDDSGTIEVEFVPKAHIVELPDGMELPSSLETSIRRAEKKSFKEMEKDELELLLHSSDPSLDKFYDRNQIPLDLEDGQ